MGFEPKVFHEEYTLSDYPVDIQSIEIVFPETNIADGMIFRGKRSGKYHNFRMDDDPVYNYIENFRGGVQKYMMESKDLISSNSFILKNKNGNLVSFIGQSITFNLSNEEI